MSNQCDHGHLRRSCEICQRDDEIAQLKAERDTACKLVVEMHNAATGSTEGPRHGVVEDIAKLKAERDAAVKALKWLDRWLGHKPMPECTAKIKAAINAARGEK